jgi:hypothetical protein
MRIESNPPIRPAASRRDGKSGSGSSFSVSVSGDQPASAPAAARPMNSIEGLFALQELPDALAERRRGVQRGTTLLDRLEDLRLALLTGELTPGQISELQRVVSSERGQFADPQLSELLDQIDLRARVELAKLSMAAGTTQKS